MWSLSVLGSHQRVTAEAAKDRVIAFSQEIRARRCECIQLRALGDISRCFSNYNYVLGEKRWENKIVKTRFY